MTTTKQINANKNNAMMSTGPKSEIGKSIVSKNARKHGIFSKQILLDDESKEEFENLSMEFYNYFQPKGLLEELFWERALSAAWRLSRITRMESLLIYKARNRCFNEDGLIDVLSGGDGDKLALLSRYEISLEKILYKSLGELRSLQNVRNVDRQINFEIKNGFVSQKLIEADI